MDPTASVDNIINISLRIIQDIKDARTTNRDRRALSSDVFSVYQTLLDLQSHLTAADHEADSARADPLEGLFEPGSTIELLGDTLDDIAEKLESNSHSRDVAWPFERGDVQKLTSRLEHHQSSIAHAMARASRDSGAMEEIELPEDNVVPFVVPKSSIQEAISECSETPDDGQVVSDFKRKYGMTPREGILIGVVAVLAVVLIAR